MIAPTPSRTHASRMVHNVYSAGSLLKLLTSNSVIVLLEVCTGVHSQSGN